MYFTAGFMNFVVRPSVQRFVFPERYWIWVLLSQIEAPVYPPSKILVKWCVAFAVLSKIAGRTAFDFSIHKQHTPSYHKVCFRVFGWVLPFLCSHLCALLCVLCALICVLSYLHFQMSFFIDVLSYMCSHICAPMFFFFAVICVFVCDFIFIFLCALLCVLHFELPPCTLFGISCRDNALIFADVADQSCFFGASSSKGFLTVKDDWPEAGRSFEPIALLRILCQERVWPLAHTSERSKSWLVPWRNM